MSLETAKAAKEGLEGACQEAAVCTPEAEVKGKRPLKQPTGHSKEEAGPRAFTNRERGDAITRSNKVQGLP